MTSGIYPMWEKFPQKCLTQIAAGIIAVCEIFTQNDKDRNIKKD